MKDDVARYYSNIHWQDHPGDPISIGLLPLINYTGKEAFSVTGIDGKEHQTEVRTIPDSLNQMVAQLINRSGYLQVTEQSPDYFIQVQVRGYQTLYSDGDDNGIIPLAWANLRRSWDQGNRVNQSADIRLTVTLLNLKGHPLVELPVSARLADCQRSFNPMTFGPAISANGEPFDQAFHSGLATTASGQAFISAINRAIVEVRYFFADRPIQATIMKVVDNELYLNLGSPLVSVADRLSLMYPASDNSPAFPVSEIEVVRTWKNMSIAHPLHVKPANVIAGDRIELKRSIQQNQFRSVAAGPVGCEEQTRTTLTGRSVSD